MTPRTILLFCALAFVAFQAKAQPGPDFFAQHLDLELQKQKIQVVFALDVTGSMSGLLSTAKDKIWTIASSLAQGEGQVEISMGIVAYRDRGDSFVTKITDLTTDLDYAYSELMALSAGGGGDGPESVNQALNDAVNQISWDEDSRTMRTIFLVGDCPPHMDYKGEKQYPEICAEAAQRDITVNSMLMGGNGQARGHWEKIAWAASGDFFDVGMDADNLAVATPFDEEIKEKSKNLEGSMIYYGSAEEKAVSLEDKSRALGLTHTLDAGAVSRRATFNTTDAGFSNQYQSNELIQQIAVGELTLDDVAEEELPEEIQALDEDEREVTVERMVTERVQTQKEIEELVAKRQVYLDTVVTTTAAESSFSGKVWGSLKRQSKKKDIKLSPTVKY